MHTFNLKGNANVAALVHLIPHSLIPMLLFIFLKIFLNKQPNPRKKLLVPCALDRPNINCYVCASKPEVTVKLNVHKTIVQALQDKVIYFNPKALIFV